MARRRRNRPFRSAKRKKKKTPRTERVERDDHVELEGTVTEVHPGNLFDVELDAGSQVVAKLSGRMRRFRIRVVLGDRVKVALSPYDLTHGLITWRRR
jgi:translation initiation factor IF-1